MNMKAWTILPFLMLILSCQSKEKYSDNIESKKITTSEEVIVEETKIEQNTVTLNSQHYITIDSLEGYHMDSSTIVKLIVEDGIVKIQTLFWENDTVKYSEAIVLEFNKVDLHYVDTENCYNFYQFYENRPDLYSFRIKTDKIIIDKSNNCYAYLGKNITDEIIITLSGQQDEYTGKYIFLRMESTETMETFVNDNNLQLSQKTATDFENSYIIIKLGGNGRYIIEPSEGLWNSLLFVDWREVFAYTDEIETGVGFYGRAGDSFQQTLNMMHYFNENRELIVFIRINNSPEYSGEYEEIIKEGKINEYKFIYKKI